MHIIKGTDLAYLYEHRITDGTYANIPPYFSENDFELMKDYKCMTLDEYTELIAECVSVIPPDIAIHRMTGDGDKKTLLAPLFSGDKKKVLNSLNKAICSQTPQEI